MIARVGSRARVSTALATLTIALTACVDPVPQQTSILDGPRVLAVIATPPEAAPRAAVHYDVIAGGPDGAIAAPAIAWAFCIAPKPPTEDNIVAPGCIDDPAVLVPIGDGPSVDATMPAEACRNDGPDVPPGGFRPRDPDASGGYYQPVRAILPGAPMAFGLHRLVCGLADAPPALIREYRDRYRANTHPAIARFHVAGDPAAIARGATVTLEASWDAAAAEPYVIYDRDAAAIVARVETLRVGWFATGGALSADATGVAAGAPATATTVQWIAPDAPGVIHMWAVLHDDRGGVGTATLDVTVP